MELSIQTTGLPETVKRIDGLENLVDAKLMATIGQHAEEMIKLRTAEGRDVDGKIFAKYIPKYALFRAENGQHQTSPPNLFFSGRMLGAMTHKTEGSDTAVVCFSDSMQSAKASGNNKKRQFFSLSAAEIQELADEIVSEITAREALL